MIEQRVVYFLEFVTVLIAGSALCSLLFHAWAEWSVSRLIRKMEQVRREAERERLG